MILADGAGSEARLLGITVNGGTLRTLNGGTVTAATAGLTGTIAISGQLTWATRR